jgi:hypothetical protein
MEVGSLSSTMVVTGGVCEYTEKLKLLDVEVNYDLLQKNKRKIRRWGCLERRAVRHKFLLIEINKNGSQSSGGSQRERAVHIV